MIKQGKTIYVCDFCKIESERKDFGTDIECGNSKLLVSGHKGQKMMDHSWGGNGVDFEADLCFSCSDKVLNVIRMTKAELSGKLK